MTGWALEAICLHLEAVVRGVMHGVGPGAINRLLENVPPGYMKSLATDVFLPAWVWGPLEWPSARFLSFSYSSGLTERDNQRFGAVVSSARYQELWGKIVTLPTHALGTYKVANKQTGWKIASSVGGMGTGERADFVIIDDPHNVKEAESEKIRTETVRWFRESVTSRMNDPETSAIIVIMQRVHEDDVSGVIITDDLGYCHLCIPQEYDGDWRGMTEIGWEDPRTEEGELAFPERFPASVIARDKIAMGPSAVSSQFQQSPTPRGGNIIMRDWWKLWPAPGYEPPQGQPAVFPPCSLIVGSVDTAYSEKDENAYNAMTVWGVWYDDRERPKVVLMEAWRARVPLRGVIPENCQTDEERKPYWGLSEKVADTIRRRNLDYVLIENKTRGHDLMAEISRIFRNGECRVIGIDPVGDKVARLHAVQALFADGMIYAPDKTWAELVITEVSQAPRAKYWDFTDTTSMCLTWLRKSGMLMFGTEADSENLQARTFKSKPENRYDV